MTRRLRIAIVYNDDTHFKQHLSPTELQGEAEVADSAGDVFNTLASHHDCSLLAIRDSLDEVIETLRSNRPDVVFSLCEGLFGRPAWEGNFVLLLEMLGLPYSGCESLTLQLAQHKGLVKRLLAGAGIATPRGLTFSPGDSTDAIEAFFTTPTAPAASISQFSILNSQFAPPAASISQFSILNSQFALPTIVKPESEDGGVGVESSSVVTSAAEAAKRGRWIHERYGQAAVIEEFIDGAELNQAMYLGRSGMVFLPPGEVVFDASLKAHERIVGAAAKWDTGSVEDLATTSRTPAHIGENEKTALRESASHVGTLLGVTGYCRIDFRRGADGTMYVIDVNPNPDIGPGSGFRKALDAAGIPFRTFLEELMLAKLAR